jgi:integrase
LQSISHDSFKQESDIAIGKRFHLHNLKRFAGILALRAGASPLELQQHMDHASLETTLKHYCQPETADLVRKRIKVPIPRKSLHTRQTPICN